MFKSLQLADESDGGDQTIDDDDSNYVNEAAKSSPTNPGTQKLAQLTIEGKWVTPDDSCAIGQLWANMMLNCVHKFIESIDQNFIIEDLISIQYLTGYGILCCQDATVAAYKLEINLM